MTFRSVIRPLAPAAAIAVLGVSVAACGSSTPAKSSSSSSASASGSASASSASASGVNCNAFKPGAASNAVKVSGTPAKPKATFHKPLKASGLQRTIIKRGSGKVPAAADTVGDEVVVYNGHTGKRLGATVLNVPARGGHGVPSFFAAGVACLPVGTEAVTAASAKSVYGANMPSPQVKPTDELVVVSRVVADQKPLVPAAWKGAQPKVTLNGNKPPKLVLPAGKPAKSLEMKILKQGSGPVVKSGDKVTLNYQGTSWTAGKMFQQSYGKAPVPLQTNAVVPGFGAALVGQKAGTSLVVSIPPKYAYGMTKSAQNPLGGQTLVFVISIVKTKSAS